MKSLTKLNFSKNVEGEFHCPVLFKSFSNSSHIVAVRTTGNVFSYEVSKEAKCSCVCIILFLWSILIL